MVFINGERHENKELQDKAEKVEKSDEAAEIIRQYEYIVRSKNRNIIGLAYQQDKAFVRLITFFGIAYLQPALPHRNFSNDVTNV